MEFFSLPFRVRVDGFIQIKQWGSVKVVDHFVSET